MAVAEGISPSRDPRRPTPPQRWALVGHDPTQLRESQLGLTTAALAPKPTLRCSHCRGPGPGRSPLSCAPGSCDALCGTSLQSGPGPHTPSFTHLQGLYKYPLWARLHTRPWGQRTRQEAPCLPGASVLRREHSRPLLGLSCDLGRYWAPGGGRSSRHRERQGTEPGTCGHKLSR